MRYMAFMIISMLVSVAQAGVVTVDHDFTMSDQDTFEVVQVVDSSSGQTMFKMLGGSVTFLMDVWDSSIALIEGGHVESLTTYETASAVVTGGTHTLLTARGASHLEASGGHSWYLAAESTATVEMGSTFSTECLDAGDNARVNVEGGLVRGDAAAYDYGTLTIMGGRFEQTVVAQEFGTINLWGGSLEGTLWARDSGTINVFGSGFAFDPLETLLTGFWLNGTPFSVRLADSDTLARTNLLPEPATCGLVLSGFFLAVGYRRKSPR